MVTNTAAGRHTDQTTGKHGTQPKHSELPSPNERDTRPEANAPRSHKKMQQASDDLSRGQVDTDQRGERGIDQAVNPENVTESPKSSHDIKKN